METIGKWICDYMGYGFESSGYETIRVIQFYTLALIISCIALVRKMNALKSKILF